MRLARIVLGVLALAGPYACGAGAAIAAPKPIEPPSLEARVEKGELPPIVQRLPDTPSVVDFRVPGGSPGQYGGELSMLMSRVKDVRMMVVYGYARLIAWTPDFRLVPDIAEKVQVKDGRQFTLLAGHRVHLAQFQPEG